MSEGRTIGDAVVSATVDWDAATASWLVTVLLGRPAGRALIEPDEVDARLLDSDAQELPVRERPTGPWVEAGGAAGVTANGRFRFAGDRKPSELVVSWHGETMRLPVDPPR